MTQMPAKEAAKVLRRHRRRCGVIKPNANHHEKMASALRVIRTWAAFDLEHPAGPRTLNPEHVLKLCEEALAAAQRQGGE